MIVTRFGLRPVWIMPIGGTPERMVTGLVELADEVVERGWNMTGRLHVLAWETKEESRWTYQCQR